MENIRFKDLLMKALYIKEGNEQLSITQGNEFLSCVLKVLANDYTDEEIVDLINNYRTNKEESTEDYPEEWAYPDKELRTRAEVSLNLIIEGWIMLPLNLLIKDDINDIKATDMEGNPLEVKRDTDIVYGPQIYYINISDLEITNQSKSVSIMIYYDMICYRDY